MWPNGAPRGISLLPTWQSPSSRMRLIWHAFCLVWGSRRGYEERSLMNIRIFSAILFALVHVGCDDTAQAIDERAEQERAELRADVERLKADLRAAESKMAEQAEELDRRAKQAAQDTKDAARDTAERGSQAVEQMGSAIEDRVDKVDKAAAKEIRGDAEPSQ